MAVPVACLHGSGLRGGRDQGRQRHLLDRLAEAALRPRRRRRGPRRAGRQGARRSGWSARAPTAAAMPATPRWTRPCSPRRSASRCACSTRATRAPAGTRRAPPRSTARARRSTPTARSSPTSSSARASRASTSTPTEASRTTRSPAISAASTLKSGDNFGVPAESYEFANKRTAWETIPPLLDRASPLRTSHLRDPVGPQIQFASESFMDEVARRSTSIRSSSGCATSRTPRDIAVIKAAAEKVGLAAAALAAARPDRQQGERPRHRLCAAQRHARGDRGRGRRRPRDRQDLGAQVHGRARLRPDHQSRRPATTRSRATSSRASAARSGRRCKFDTQER